MLKELSKDKRREYSNAEKVSLDILNYQGYINGITIKGKDVHPDTGYITEKRN